MRDSVTAAVRLMYLGALANLVSFYAGIPNPDAIRDSVRRSTTDNADTAAKFAVAGFWITVGIIGLVTTGLWLWMARKNRQRRPWARTVATVLFGLYTVLTILGFAGAGSMKPRGFVMFASLATWAIGLAVIVLLYRPSRGVSPQTTE
jgi:CDP-diglyceride synthetase